MKHLSLRKLADIAAEDTILIQKSDSLHAEQCQVCSERIEKLRCLFKKLTEMEFSQSERASTELISGNKTDEEILQFLLKSEQKKSIEPIIGRNIYNRKNILNKKITIASGIGLIAASLLIIFNFFYEQFFSRKEFIPINTSEKNCFISTRKGLLFSEKIIQQPDSILIFQDKVKTLKDAFINTGHGIKVYAKKESAFSFIDEEKIFWMIIDRGNYLLEFKKKYKKKLKLKLPQDCIVTITGTTLIIESNNNTNSIYVKKGSADLFVDKKDKIRMQTKHVYLIEKNNSTGLHSVEDSKINIQEEKRIIAPFTEIINKEDHASNKKDILLLNTQKDKGRGKINNEYSALSIIETKDNKRYIGTFKLKGKTVQVATKRGIIAISSDKIKKISPYKK